MSRRYSVSVAVIKLTMPDKVLIRSKLRPGLTKMIGVSVGRVRIFILETAVSMLGETWSCHNDDIVGRRLPGADAE
jgi:hypothetical protein